MESYLLPAPASIKGIDGKTRQYPKGTWIVTAEITDEQTIAETRKGVFKGFSATTIPKYVCFKKMQLKFDLIIYRGVISMVEKLIPNYDFVKNWSEDQLRNFITTPSGLPHRLMSIVREVIPNINRLRLIQCIEHPEFKSLDQDERAVTHRLKYEGKHKEAREYHIQYALDFLDKYPQFKPMVKIVE